MSLTYLHAQASKFWQTPSMRRFPAHVGYLPSGRIVGRSKLARVVEGFARGLQVRERLTKQIADCLVSPQPKAVGAVLEAEHLCMSLRGVRAMGRVH
jgi:GTP cyclohydrolase IA